MSGPLNLDGLVALLCSLKTLLVPNRIASSNLRFAVANQTLLIHGSWLLVVAYIYSLLLLFSAPPVLASESNDMQLS